ncbi:MAG: FG-GAP-like repeat-containing protein [Deltaproteobacteria bacterium]
MRAHVPLLCVLAACADLDVVEPDVCGNNVVEAPREDCDLVVDPALGANLTCGAPGFFGACRYLCGGGAECPEGWGCFEDRICRPPSGAFDFDDEPVHVLRADDFIVANFLGDATSELAVRLDGELTILSLDEDASSAVLSAATFGATGGVMTSVPIDDDGVDDRMVLFGEPASVAFETPGCLDPYASTSTLGVSGALLDQASFRLPSGARRIAMAFEDTVVLGETRLDGAGCVLLANVERRAVDGVERITFDGDALIAATSETVASASPPDFAFAEDPRYAALTERVDAQSRACSEGPAWLTAGHLRARPRYDVVTEDGVYFATATGFERVYVRARGDAWAEAAIGDFDDDGLADIVVTTRSESADCDAVDLRLLRQATPGVFTSVPISNVQLPRALDVGDFDGDGVDDVVLVERTRDEEDAVTVLFGGATNPLQDLSSAYGFDAIVSVEASITRAASTLNPDRTADVLVTPEDEDTYVVLLGSARRALLSPIPLGAGPLAVTAGLLDDPEAETPDLVGLGDGAVYFVSGDDLDTGGPATTSAVDLGAFRSECALLATTRGGAVIGVDGTAACDAGPSTLLLATRDDEGFEVVTSEAPAGRPTWLEVGDLDDDGEDEALVYFATEDERGAVYVLWNLRAEEGALAYDAERVLGGLRVRAATLVDVDDDPRPEVAVYTDDGLFTVDYDVRDDALYAVPAPITAPLDVEDDGDAQLRAGRVDDDELEDLVLFLGGGVYVFTTEPRR